VVPAGCRRVLGSAAEGVVPLAAPGGLLVVEHEDGKVGECLAGAERVAEVNAVPERVAEVERLDGAVDEEEHAARGSGPEEERADQRRREVEDGFGRVEYEENLASRRDEVGIDTVGERNDMIRIEGSGSGPWRLVQKDSMQTNTVRHVFAFGRVCSYHGVYSFVFVHYYLQMSNEYYLYSLLQFSLFDQKSRLMCRIAEYYLVLIVASMGCLYRSTYLESK
jgi:hypothetical protein